MAWYRAGSVTVTGGSATVTGVGTAFVGPILAGDGFVGPDGRSYEVAAVVSATQLTLARAYAGATQAGAAYSIFPTQSRVIDQAAALDSLISNYQGAYSGPGQGRFSDGTLAAPGIRFAADDDTGIRRAGANALAAVCGGVDLLTLSGAGAALGGKLTGAAAQSLGPVFATYGGTANAIALTYGVAAVTVGTAVRFRATATNTGAATINLDGKGAVACRTVTGAALPAGYIRTDAFTSAVFDGTNWVVGRETEQGSNANGKFTRFGDGFQVCRSGDIPAEITSAVGAVFRSTPAIWTYPAGFADSPFVTGGSVNNTLFLWVTAGQENGSSCYGAAFSYQSLTNREYALMAVGRWY